MPFYKWVAIDAQEEKFEGVQAARQFELVAIALLQQGLSPCSIQSISYAEFKSLKLIQDRIEMLQRKQEAISGFSTRKIPVPIVGNTRSALRYSWLLGSLLAIIVAASVIALAYHYYPR